MPRLIKNISTSISETHNANIKIMGVSGRLDIEDYIETKGLLGLIQNFLHANAITELLIDGTDVYRSPDDGNHPTPSVYGLYTNYDYSELTISYT